MIGGRFDSARVARAFLLLVLMTGPAAPTVVAQPTAVPTDQVRRAARIHAGPFYIRPFVQLTQFGIDTNVFNQPTDPKADFTFAVSPTMQVSVPLARRALLRADTEGELVWFQRFASERSFNPELDARGELYLHRTTLFGGVRTLRTRQRPNFEIDVRSRRVENSVTAGAGVTLTRKTSLEVEGRRQSYAFDADAVFLGTSLQEQLSRTTAGVLMTARHRLTAFTTLALKAETVTERFDFSAQRDSGTLRILPGVELNPRALISGRAYVGYRRLRRLAPLGMPEFRGMAASLALSYRFAQASTLSMTYDRDLRYSLEPLQPYSLDNSVGLSARRALGRKFDATISAERHLYRFRNLDRDYRTGADLTGVLAPREDVTLTFSGSFGYRVGIDGRIGIGGTWGSRVSTRPGRSFDSARFGTTVSYGF